MRHLDLTRRPVLYGAVIAMLALPVASAAGLTPVGGFRMFAEPVEYRAEIEIRVADGSWHPLPTDAVLPHVGPGARRTLAHTDRYRLGGAQARLLAGGLEDLAVLVCRVSPEATESRASVRYRSASGSAPADRTVVMECEPRP